MDLTVWQERTQSILSRSFEKLPEIALTVLVGYLAIKIIKFTLRSVIRVTLANQAMKGIILSVVDIGLWILLLAVLLHQVGLTQISLALSGSVGVAGLAVSTGSAAFVQDLVSGLFLAQDPDFNVGQRVTVGEVEGTVEKMDARKIRLRDDKGNLHIFPNSTFDRASWIVKNKSSRSTR